MCPFTLKPLPGRVLAGGAIFCHATVLRSLFYPVWVAARKWRCRSGDMGFACPAGACGRRAARDGPGLLARLEGRPLTLLALLLAMLGRGRLELRKTGEVARSGPPGAVKRGASITALPLQALPLHALWLVVLTTGVSAGRCPIDDMLGAKSLAKAGRAAVGRDGCR